MSSLCDHCHKNNTRVPFKRKRGQSETSAKSVFSGVSADTQLSYISDDEDDLECDGESTDTNNTIAEAQLTEKPKFTLASNDSLNTPVKNTTPLIFNGQDNRNNSNVITQRANQRQIALARNTKRWSSRLRSNVSESDTSCYDKFRRFSADEGGLTEGIRQESFVLLNELDHSDVRVLVKRNPTPVRSAPNLNRIEANEMNLYDSIQENGSAYAKNIPVNKNRLDANERMVVDDDNEDIVSAYEELLKDHKHHKKHINMLILAMSVSGLVIIVLVVLMVLLLMSAIPPRTIEPDFSPLANEIAEPRPDINIKVAAFTEPPDLPKTGRSFISNATAANRNPIRLEGAGLIEEQDDYQTHYRLVWTISERDVQNPITLAPSGEHVRVSLDGYYYIFCRIHYKCDKPNVQFSRVTHVSNPFVVQHSLYRVNNRRKQDDKLDAVTQHYVSKDFLVEHTSTLQTIVHLKAGDEIYIRLKNGDFIDRNFNSHVMGIFLV